MAVGMPLIAAVRLTKMARAIQDVRELPQQLLFEDRVPDVDATDGEIIGREVGRVQIADIIADDQRAVTYSTGKLTFESVQIPNIKVGIHFTQQQLNQLEMVGALGGLPQAAGGTTSLYAGGARNAVRERVARVTLGVRQRKEVLKIGMMLDSVSYDRLGIKFTATFGMPADLKQSLTGGATWDQAGTADPIANILTQLRVGSTRYGRVWNRLTMSTQAFIYMTATTTFQARAKSVFLQYGAVPSTLPLQDTVTMRRLAEALTGMTIELYDARYWSQDAAGIIQSAPFWPINVVLFSSTADDGNTATWDFANSIVTESIVSSILGSDVGGVVGDLGGAQRGPVAYVTGNPSLNPPDLTLWGVARGFPRKYDLAATSTLTVGAFVDSIPVGEPF